MVEIVKCAHANTSYQAVLSYCAVMLYKMVPTFQSVKEIVKCDHSNESYGAVPSCGAVFQHSNESYGAVSSCGAVF